MWWGVCRWIYKDLWRKTKETFQGPSTIYNHANNTGHHTSVDKFSIVGRESDNLTRTIKWAMYIRVKDPSINKKIGKYQLSQIWDEVLLNTPDLKPKQTTQYYQWIHYAIAHIISWAGVRGTHIMCHHITRQAWGWAFMILIDVTHTGTRWHCMCYIPMLCSCCIALPSAMSPAWQYTCHSSHNQWCHLL